MNEYRVGLAAAVVSGYVLGRRKKARLVLALGAYLVGRHLGVAPGRLLPQALGALQSPQVRDLADLLRGELLTASHAVVAAADRRLADLAEALRDRADALDGVVSPGRRGYGHEDEWYEDYYESDENEPYEGDYENDGYGDGYANEAEDAYEDAREEDRYPEDEREGDQDAYDEQDDTYGDEYRRQPGDVDPDAYDEDEPTGAAGWESALRYP